MKNLAMASLLLVIALTWVSAYLRLDNSGIGCQDWPDCYALIGSETSASPTLDTTYERLANDARQPTSWATPVHRLVASILGLFVAAMALWSLLRKRDRVICLTLLALTVLLAWLGIYSAGLHNPAVVMANLGGGFTMLGLLGWMSLRTAQPAAPVQRVSRSWVIAALICLAMQIALGGLTSANFAATACQALPDCHGTYLPGADILTAFDLSRTHAVDSTGLVLGGDERADIHKLHRIGALIATLVILVVAIKTFKAGFGLSAIVVLVLLCAEVSVAIAAVLSDIPIGVAVAHNGLAALLLLSLIGLLAMCNNQQAPL